MSRNLGHFFNKYRIRDNRKSLGSYLGDVDARVWCFALHKGPGTMSKLFGSRIRDVEKKDAKSHVVRTQGRYRVRDHRRRPGNTVIYSMKRNIAYTHSSKRTGFKSQHDPHFICYHKSRWVPSQPWKSTWRHRAPGHHALDTLICSVFADYELSCSEVLGVVCRRKLSHFRASDGGSRHMRVSIGQTLCAISNTWCG